MQYHPAPLISRAQKFPWFSSLYFSVESQELCLRSASPHGQNGRDPGAHPGESLVPFDTTHPDPCNLRPGPALLCPWLSIRRSHFKARLRALVPYIRIRLHLPPPQQEPTLSGTGIRPHHPARRAAQGPLSARRLVHGRDDRGRNGRHSRCAGRNSQTCRSD